MIEIKLDDLEEIFNILKLRTEEIGLKTIKLDQDFYWTIYGEDKINFNTPSPKVCVGSLVDDLDSLKKILSGDNPATNLDFERLGNLLIAIGIEISTSGQVFTK